MAKKKNGRPRARMCDPMTLCDICKEVCHHEITFVCIECELTHICVTCIVKHENNHSIKNACFSNDIPLLMCAIENGDINWRAPKDGIFPLYIAAAKGYTSFLKVLTEHGAKIDQITESGWTALHVASMQGHIEIIQILAEAGADMNLPLVYSNRSPVTAIACRSGHVDALIILLEAGSDMNACDSLGQGAVHFACQLGQVHCLRILVGRGADYNKPDKYGVTPIVNAVMFGHADCVGFLLARNAVWSPVIPLVTAIQLVFFKLN